MRRTLCLIAMVFVAFAWLEPSVLTYAGPGDPAGPPPDKKAVVSKERPFIETAPDWDEGVELARKCVEGDEEAVEKFKNSGLTWASHMTAVDYAHNLLLDAFVRHHDWIKDMQRWEAAFAGTAPEGIAALYEELEPRFRVKEAQLARAILHAWRWGDTDTQKKLIAKNPDSKWVKGAIAFTGEGMELKEAIDVLQELLPEVDQVSNLRLFLRPALIVPANRRLRPHSREARFADIELMFGSEGIQQLYQGPPEWDGELYYERLGALVNEVGSPDYTRSAETEVRDYAVNNSIRASRFEAFSLAAWVGNSPFDRVMPEMFVNSAKKSAGMNLAVYAMHYCHPWMLNEVCTSSALAFHGMRDITLCRRLFLARYMGHGDSLLARLAARAVLAFGDDSKAAYNDVARAIVRFGKDPELERAFAKALAASGNDELVKIGGAVAGRAAEKLDSAPKGTFGLSLQQKADLLAVFAHEDELAAHGGEVGVYWLNRAVFHEGTRSVQVAIDAYWHAMRAAEGNETGDNLTANMVQYFLFCERNLATEAFDHAMTSQTAKHKALGARVKKCWDKFWDRDAGTEWTSLFQAFGARARLQELEEDVLKELCGHPERWGGTGLMLASESEFRSHRFTHRRELIEQAMRTTPLCFHSHVLLCNDHETYATLEAANWEVAAIHGLALCAVSPYSLDNLAQAGSLRCRSGEFGCSLWSLSLTGNLRPGLRRWGGRAHEQIMPLSYGRRWHQDLLQRHILVDPDSAKRHARDYEQVLFELGYCYQSANWIQHTAMGSEVEHFRMQVTDDIIANFNMDDVNNLLNFAYATCLFWPDQSLTWVDMADSIGVSRYGRFVGTQSVVAAKARKGELSEALDRYHDMRADDVGMPSYLDNFMLAGLNFGNNYAEADKALEAIGKYEHSEEDSNFLFMLRRARMMAGDYEGVGDVRAPEYRPFQLEDGHAYSPLFHESRLLLEKGEFAAIAERAKPYMDFEVEAGLGVYLDAALLRALAMKLDDKDIGLNAKKKTLKAIEPEFADIFLATPRMMDCIVLEMLCGRRAVEELPPATGEHLWHGAAYGERTFVHTGSGMIRMNEVNARHQFIGGVLAFLVDDKKAAAEKLDVCVQWDQRASYEYHVAQWLLKRISEKKD